MNDECLQMTALSKALSTLATIVADFGDCRRFRRQFVAEFSDCSRA